MSIVSQLFAAGDNHACMVLTGLPNSKPDGLYCWGSGGNGQLGTDNTNNQGDGSGEMANLQPVNLGNGRSAIAISAGYLHTCAILDDSTLKCWGQGGDGQLGYDNNTNVGDGSGTAMASLGTVNLGSGRTAKAVSAGGSHTCAILDNDQLKCWGNNNVGQLGFYPCSNAGKGGAGDIAMASLQAIDLGNNSTAKAVSCGMSFTCALLDNDDLKVTPTIWPLQIKPRPCTLSLIQ